MTIDANGEIRLNGIQALLDDPDNGTRLYITEHNNTLTFRVFVREHGKEAIMRFTEKCRFTMTKAQFLQIGEKLFRTAEGKHARK